MSGWYASVVERDGDAMTEEESAENYNVLDGMVGQQEFLPGWSAVAEVFCRDGRRLASVAVTRLGYENTTAHVL